MTKKIMLINETDDESRVAIVEDSLLQEMLIEHRTIEQTKNNIYKGTIVQIQSALQAAFVDFGHKKHGFLPSSEINASLYQRKNLNNNSPIQQKLKKGQTVLVQVTREAVDQKGAALTTNISLPGRFMVLMPNSNKGGISKKIEDSEERDRLKSFISAIDAEKHSAIIRTAGVGRDLVELKKDYTALKKTWEEILRNFKEIKKPGLILEEPDVVIRTLRDYYAEDIEEIWVDNPETFQKALEFLKQAAPRRQKDLKLFVGDRSLFSSYKIERQVEQLTSRDVKLDSGGSIVIDQTEALVAIDVNSGKSNQEGDIDATALRTNLEAARELARQLRLRNLGGLIVVDFIDMESEKSRKKVEEELQNAMSRDKAQRKYNPISQFGLLEMSRQRLSVGISSTVESVCPVCNGKGRIPSLLASTNLILRSIRETAARGNLIQIEGVLPLELANHLLNERRQSITDLELEFGVDIILRGDPEITVFNENQLKPSFTAKKQGGKGDGDSAPDSQKGDDDKRKSRQKDKGASKKSDTSGKKKEVVDKKSDATDKNQKEDVKSADEPDKTPKDQPLDSTKPVAEAEKETEGTKRNRKPVKSAPAGNREEGIHPSALFSNVQEVDPEKLAVITSSFENRLKGKPDNQVPLAIDQKYLWKNKTPLEESRKESQESADTPKEIVPGEQAEKTVETLREDGVEEIANIETTTDTAMEGTLREDTESGEKKRSAGKQRRKKTSGKTSSSKTETAKQKKAAAKPSKKPATKTDEPADEDLKPAKSAKKTSGSSRTKKANSKKETDKKAAVPDVDTAEKPDSKSKTKAKKTSEKKKKTGSTSESSKKTAAKKEPQKKSQGRQPSSEKKRSKPVKAKKTTPRAKKDSKPVSDEKAV